MKKHLSKKRVVLAAIVTVALALASGVAYAYWTSNGTGGATANAAAGSNTIGITATGVAGIYPSATGQTVTFSATNSGNTSSPVGTIKLDTVTSTGLCQTMLTAHPNQFTMVDVPVTAPAVIAANTVTPVLLTPTGTLKWVDGAYDQSDCKNAALTFNFKSS